MTGAQARPPRYYPVFIDLRDKPCLVVGAGPVAAGKIGPLLEAGGLVTVVSPEAVPAVRQWHEAGRLNWISRKFRESDLDGRFLVIAATSEPAANQWVYDAGEARRMLVNVVDETERCNFITPAIARSGPVQVAISTAGTCPTLAKRLRREIQATLLGEDTGRLAEFMARWRPEAKRRIAAFEDKVAFWRNVFDSEIVDLAAAGAWDEGDRRMAEMFESEGFGAPERALAAAE